MLFTRPVRTSDASVQPLVTSGDAASLIGPGGSRASGEGEASGDETATPSDNDASEDPNIQTGGGFDDFTSADYGTELGEDWMHSAGAGSDALLADDKGFAPFDAGKPRSDRRQICG